MNIQFRKPFINQQDGSTVNYFAYGANLSSKTMSKRSVLIIEITSPPVPCRVKDPSIVFAFCHRSGYATLIHRNRSLLEQAWVQLHDGLYKHAHGVLYTLTPEQLQKIQKYEVGYTLSPIEVTPYNSNSTDTPHAVHAVTFTSSLGMLLRHPVLPTDRYKSLILQGAREHALDDEYIAWLANMPTTSDSVAQLSSRQEYSNTLFEAICRWMVITISVLSCGYFTLSL